jgi:drug/metabolite transporter (DMT)-like permease
LAINPVTAGILGSLLLHEVIDLWMVGATVLIGVGLWLATRPRQMN